jgi:hypothetical protein
VTQKGLFIFIAAMLCSIGLAYAGEPAAIVEDVSGTASGVQQMDILDEGRVIELGKDTTLTLGYLRSCIREVVTGGSVTVGKDRSKVENGVRKEEEVDCDGGLVIKSSQRGAEVAGAVFRQGKITKPLPKPNWTLYSTNPFLRLSKPSARIRIERLDKSSEKPIDLAITGLLIDLSKAGVQLDPGGLYALSDDSKTYIVKVSPLAEPEAPFLSRLIPM